MEYSNQLYHHGVKGMKWGVRRYQNKNGSLTNAGKRRYKDSDQQETTSKKGLSSKQKTALKIGAAAAGTALAAYGAYRVSKVLKQKAYHKAYESGMKAANKMLSKDRVFKLDTASKFTDVATEKNNGFDAVNRILRELDNKEMRKGAEVPHYASTRSKNLREAVKTLRDKTGDPDGISEMLKNIENGGYNRRKIYDLYTPGWRNK